MIFFKKYLILSAYFILFCFGAWAQVRDFPVFSNEFWFVTENVPVFGDINRDEQAEAQNDEARIKELLDEAVFVYSGMIYGFTFSYTPSDLRRGVGEEFSMIPTASIQYGDPAMRARSTRREGSRTIVRLEYRCEERHQAWLNFWNSSVFPVIAGAGSGSNPVIRGAETRIEAIEQAVKESVRTYMRGRIHNKPRSISGSFVFTEPPVVRYSAGLYTATVRMKVDIMDVEAYKFF